MKNMYYNIYKKHHWENNIEWKICELKMNHLNASLQWNTTDTKCDLYDALLNFKEQSLKKDNILKKKKVKIILYSQKILKKIFNQFVRL